VNIVDVGPGGDAGGSYGWRIKEGTASFDFSTLPDPGNLIDPVAEYAQPGSGGGTVLEVGISVTGGFVYRGADIPALDGRYVFADWSTTFSAPGAGTLLGMESDGDGGWEISVLDLVGDNPLPYFINAFGRDEAGELYIAAKTQLAASGTNNGQPTGVVLRLRDGEQQSLTLTPSRDTSIYAANTANSNGAGTNLFSGATSNGAVQRALLTFDIATAIPPGSQIDAATLQVQINSLPPQPAGAGIFTLHRGLTDWGEGSSNSTGGSGAPATSGDATWINNFFPDTTWNTPGGDFTPTASATTDTGATTGLFSFSSAALAADVELWSATPASNCGWFLIGGTENRSTRRFSSRETTTAANRPALTIDFIPAPAHDRYLAWRRGFLPPGTFIDDAADLDNDGLANLIDYAFAFDPTAFDSTGRPTVSITPEGDFLLTYRRDPRATDLTYRAEVSSTLLPELWSPLAESAAGAATTGPGFVSEVPIPGEKPLLLVTVRDTIAAPDGTIRFLRLFVERTP